jgi:hypothetical protein
MMTNSRVIATASKARREAIQTMPIQIFNPIWIAAPPAAARNDAKTYIKNKKRGPMPPLILSLSRYETTNQRLQNAGRLISLKSNRW